MIGTLCADTKCVFPHLDCRHAVSLRCSNPCLITECDSNTAKYCPVSTHVHNLGQLGLICPASSRIAQAPCFATMWHVSAHRGHGDRRLAGTMMVTSPQTIQNDPSRLSPTEPVPRDCKGPYYTQWDWLQSFGDTSFIVRNVLWIMLIIDTWDCTKTCSYNCLLQSVGHAFYLLSDSCPWIMLSEGSLTAASVMMTNNTRQVKWQLGRV